MKLNYKRVFFVSLAFFLITMFWQCYDTIMPKMLTDKFGMSQTLSGVLMALDNVLALFLLPFFGSLSDKNHKSKLGRRTPYILIGTIVACVLFISLSFADNWQLTHISDISEMDSQKSLSTLYNAELGEASDAIHEKYKTEEDFLNINVYEDENKSVTSQEYKDYVLPARQAYAWQKTVENPAPLILFIVILLFILLSMSTFRSPAVALMPDITPKPLRSKANAVVNLMGTLAGAIVLVLGIVFGTGKVENTYMSYSVFFSVIAGLMLISLIVFRFTVKEKEWAAEAKRINEEAGLENEAAEAAAEAGKRHLTSGELRSLILLLASVAFWFIGYNAVTSKYSVYAGEVLGMDYNMTLIVALAVATVAFLPVAFLSSRLGRKKVILGGIVMLAVSFGAAYFINSNSPMWLINMLFALAGIGWASINVNSFPMVVELATGSDVGRYTGFYYAASMSAQIIAPMLSGIFLDSISMRALFPFGAISVCISFVTMLFVKHGDSKPLMKKDLLDNMEESD